MFLSKESEIKRRNCVLWPNCQIVLPARHRLVFRTLTELSNSKNRRSRSARGSKILRVENIFAKRVVNISVQSISLVRHVSDSPHKWTYEFKRLGGLWQLDWRLESWSDALRFVLRRHEATNRSHLREIDAELCSGPSHLIPASISFVWSSPVITKWSLPFFFSLILFAYSIKLFLYTSNRCYNKKIH